MTPICRVIHTYGLFYMDLDSHLKLFMRKSVISPWWSNNNCSQPYLSKATLCTRDDRGIPEIMTSCKNAPHAAVVAVQSGQL